MSDDSELDLDTEQPTQADLRLVAAAPEPVRDRIDAALLRDAGPTWSKMARLVAKAMIELEHDLPEVSYAFYAHRLRQMVESGVLEYRGNLQVMRFCELRRPGP